jgi:MoaA/NifB/PqqE/SkfB family radical SAM enzyme
MDIYRATPMFLSLRNAAEFEGRCGECDFHAICGGSRARAWAASGNLLGEDSLCDYRP